jgi:Leucine-rich repeat (LRR) protein
MWRTSNRFYILVVLSSVLGCSKQASTPNESPSVSPSVSPSNRAAGASSAGQAEPSFEAQHAQVLRGESIAIQLSQVKLTSEQLSQLSALSDKLLELQLDAGVIDDSTIESLAQLTALEHLRLRDSPISDVGITKLDPSKLPNLRIINLPQSKLTAAGLEHLAKFPRLVQLRLSASLLDDRAAEVLVAYPALRSLHLIGPKFTDAALDQLAQASKLSSLYIDECHLSDAAWERLFKSKPNIHVHIDQHHHDRDPNPDH